jgi:hypothetical protein
MEVRGFVHTTNLFSYGIRFFSDDNSKTFELLLNSMVIVA